MLNKLDYEINKVILNLRNDVLVAYYLSELAGQTSPIVYVRRMPLSIRTFDYPARSVNS